MQRQLSFLERPPEGTVLAWDALDDEQRKEIVTMLARMIAKVATARGKAAQAEEKKDE